MREGEAAPQRILYRPVFTRGFSNKNQSLRKNQNKGEIAAGLTMVIYSLAKSRICDNLLGDLCFSQGEPQCGHKGSAGDYMPFLASCY